MKKKKFLLLAIELFGVAAILFGVFVFQKRAEEQDAGLVSAEDAARRYRPSISYQDKDYPLKRNMSRAYTLLPHPRLPAMMLRS